MAVLLIDNYDSFTHNLYQLFGELGAEVVVHRNDAIEAEDVAALAPSHIILSPGPGHPRNERDFGVCRAVVERFGPSTPLLGVCLGHQGIVHELGGDVVRAPAIVHGKTSRIRHDGAGLFAGIEQGVEVMRYHSFIVEPDTLPPVLRVTATTEDGLIMGVEHTEWPMVGVQFHPESIGTPCGPQLAQNFLSMGAPQ
jgi:anthranilate synthase component II